MTKKANAVIESKTMLTEFRKGVEKSAIAVDSQEMFLKVFSCWRQFVVVVDSL